MTRETWQKVVVDIEELLPSMSVGEDLDGQVIIYTGLYIERTDEEADMLDALYDAYDMEWDRMVEELDALYDARDDLD